MGNRLYVGNLNFKTTDESLRSLFSEAGSVDSVKVIMDRETGRSKGFAFVEMSDDTAAQAAVQKFNGFSLDGRPLKVSEARPQEPRENNNRGPRRY